MELWSFSSQFSQAVTIQLNLRCSGVNKNLYNLYENKTSLHLVGASSTSCFAVDAPRLVVYSKVFCFQRHLESDSIVLFRCYFLFPGLIQAGICVLVVETRLCCLFLFFFFNQNRLQITYLVQLLVTSFLEADFVFSSPPIGIWWCPVLRPLGYTSFPSLATFFWLAQPRF